jgi:hypothetical protein
MKLDEDELYIKIVDLDTVHKLVDEKFLICNYFESQNIV